MKLSISLYVIAAVLASAHFLREGNFALLALCLAAPLLFAWRRRTSLVLMQLFAYAAAANWIAVAVRLARLRSLVGQPWTSAVVILGAVVLFTLLAGVLLNTRAVRRHYPW